MGKHPHLEELKQIGLTLVRSGNPIDGQKVITASERTRTHYHNLKKQEKLINRLKADLAAEEAKVLAAQTALEIYE